MNRRFTLKNIFLAVYKRVWLIVILSIIGGVIGFAYSTYYIEPQYASNVTFVVENSSADYSSDVTEDGDHRQITAGDQNSAAQLINTYKKILTSRYACQQIADKVYNPDVPAERYTTKQYTYSQIAKMLEIKQDGDSQIMKLIVTCPSAEDAQIIADAFFISAENIIKEKFTGGYIKPLDNAQLNKSRVAPSRTLYTLVCGIIVGIFSVLIIVIVALLDKRIKSEDDIAALCTIPVIGTIPHAER